MHAGVFIACMHSLTISGFSALPYVALILVLQGWHLNKTIQQHWLFLQPRQWQFDGSEMKLLLNGNWQVVWPKCGVSMA